MNLNQLLQKRLSEYTELTDLLTKFAGKPAVFSTEAPTDQMQGWQNGVQYPRVTYTADMQANAERNSQGTLTVACYTDKTSLIILSLASAVKDAMRDTLLCPTDDTGPFAFAWARTDGFSLPDVNTMGQIITFDIVEYPDQTTTDPDPQIALSRFVKKKFPDYFVLGLDKPDEILETGDKPLFYVEVIRLRSTTGPTMNTVQWLLADMRVHVLYPNSAVRQKLCAACAELIAKEEDVPLDDLSPLTIVSSEYDATADYLRTGQIAVSTSYGILKTSPKQHKIEGVNNSYG